MDEQDPKSMPLPSAEEVWAILANVGRRLDKTSEEIAELRAAQAEDRLRSEASNQAFEARWQKYIEDSDKRQQAIEANIEANNQAFEARNQAFEARNQAFEARWKKYIEDSDKRQQAFEARMREYEAADEKRNLEAEKRHQEAYQRHLLLDRKIDKLARMYGGFAENQREGSEGYYYRSLDRSRELHGIRFDKVARNLHLHERVEGRDVQAECDLLLVNGDKVVVGEVKSKLHPSDVDRFHDHGFPRLRRLLRQFSGHKFIGCLAADNVPEESLVRAQLYGFLVLTRSDTDHLVLNPPDFQPVEY